MSWPSEPSMSVDISFHCTMVADQCIELISCRPACPGSNVFGTIVEHGTYSYTIFCISEPPAGRALPYPHAPSVRVLSLVLDPRLSSAQSARLEC